MTKTHIHQPGAATTLCGRAVEWRLRTPGDVATVPTIATGAALPVSSTRNEATCKQCRALAVGGA